MQKCPCKGCELREVTEYYNCHSHCKPYLEWKADSKLEQQQLQAFRNDQRIILADIYGSMKGRK